MDSFHLIKPSRMASVYFLVFGLTSGGLCQEPTYDPKVFSSLNLDVKELEGSRWALENHDEIVVYNAVEIVDIVKVDVNEMCIRVEFHLKQRWYAKGLKLPEGLFKHDDKPNTYVSADEDVLESVWSPDSFIPIARETKIHSATALHSIVNIFSNATIVYKVRMYTILGCSFTFEWYPLDIQACDLIIESYITTADTVKYEWEPVKPISKEENIILYQYDLKWPPKLYQGSHSRWAGLFKFGYAKATLRFERKLGNNVIQIFIPTILVVILSFFSFWLGLDAIPGRISLLVTCLLTLVTMHTGLRGVIPNVNYIKMMDIWIIGCMCFVFGAILEMIIVIYMKINTQQTKARKEEEAKYQKNLAMLRKNIGMQFPAAKEAFHEGPPGCIPPHFDIPHDSHSRHTQSDLMFGGQFPLQPPSRPIFTKVDRVSRIVFPLLFVAFNGAYWPILFTGSAKQHPEA